MSLNIVCIRYKEPSLFANNYNKIKNYHSLKKDILKKESLSLMNMGKRLQKSLLEALHSIH